MVMCQNTAYFLMSCGLFLLFLSKCRAPWCSLSLWMERTLWSVSSAVGWCWLWGTCSSAHLCHLQEFPCVPQAPLPEHRGQHHPRAWVSELQVLLQCECLRMYSHQYINILIHVSCHNSGLNWIKGLDLFNIVYFDSNLLQNNSQCRVFQSCYS